MKLPKDVPGITVQLIALEIHGDSRIDFFTRSVPQTPVVHSHR